MIRRFTSRLQSFLLEGINQKRGRHFTASVPSEKTASYIVVTPHLVHLAPLAAQNAGEGIFPVFVINGLSPTDIKWLTEVSPATAILPLLASLSGNRESLIEHGRIIDTLIDSENRPFFIQDADCFITDRAYWDQLGLASEHHYASGPFLRTIKSTNESFPETFLLGLNLQLLRRYRTSLGLSARCATTARRKLQTALTDAGYPEGHYLETLKDSYDTLQQYWVLARHDGYLFRHCEGEDEEVFHIGGTSYLFRQFDDLAHWDYWPLAVHYFHLRLLEMPTCAPFRSRFARIFEVHQSSEKLLEGFPDFASGWRRKNADLVIEKMDAAKLYSSLPG